MSLTTLRSDLAAVLTPALDPIVFYDHPAEVIVLPAVVFAPRDPYCRPRTLGQPAQGVRVEYDLAILVPRGSELDTSLDEIEAIAETLMITTAQTGHLWIDLGAPEAVKVNEIDTITARMAYAATT